MTFTRYSLIYGLLVGAVIAGIISTLLAIFGEEGPFATYWFGYLVQLVGLTFVFVGVKRYRDVERGGVIKFFPALGLGLAIALTAAIAYALVWEIYLALTHYSFMADYIDKVRHGLEAKHTPPAEIAKQMAEMQAMAEAYKNPLFRIPMTMVELIVPLGLVVPIFSAGLLCFPKILPARAAQ
ncbi:DUF4199 domain-containing protein [Sphingomonas sp. LB-2]|uniref:DUF4199 domain-containing protein n=1 Tax=Sphingomonas caeni TaxID=2984949 RepID=UPI00222EDD64|nr:DUF4199 domain-containing protein [Sphingomonas caeni]MCW3846320.1 DUF4199 domain-containing protein [Sphingomonas caeni]